MEIEEFTDGDIRDYARSLYNAVDGLGTDEDEFFRIRSVIDLLPEEEKSNFVNRVDKEIRELSGGESLRDLIIDDFSSVEERDMLEAFGFPNDFGEGEAYANQVLDGDLSSNFSHFGKSGNFYRRNAGKSQDDGVPSEFETLIKSQGGGLEPTPSEAIPDEEVQEDPAEILEDAPEMPDMASQANQAPTSFNNPVTTSAEPAFTAPQMKMEELPEDPDERARIAQEAALQTQILGPAAALKQKIRDAQLDRDFPMQEVPSLPPKNANIRGEDLDRLKNHIRDINASNFESQKALKKRNSILGGSDFDHFVKSLADMGVDTDPRDMDKNTLFRLYDRYRYNRPSMVIPSSNRQIGQRIQDRNSTIQNEDDMFTAYAGPSTGGQLKMVRKAEADRLSDLDNARTQESQVPEMTEEEGAAFWDSGFRNRNNWY